MNMTALTAISPLDGRYAKHTSCLRPLVSEYGLIKYRIIVEIRWLQFLADHSQITEVPAFSKQANQFLENLISNFDEQQAGQVKAIEATTNHDVKAVEYYLKEKIKEQPELNQVSEFIHFACTSEDINNLAYALMLRDCQQNIFLPTFEKMIAALTQLATQHAKVSMLARTHGQAASPTTVGKEFAVFVHRLRRQQQQLQAHRFNAKINGAVGNFNAHHISYPEIDWQQASHDFIQQFDLVINHYTTQIEPHDSISEFFAIVMRINTILVDLARDIWGYIALDYFKQKPKDGEVGSSTMPHKVNPIDFENAEGNLSLANAVMSFLAQRLGTSRWQRDLVDSTLLRNIGVCMGYSLVAYESLQKGLSKLEINHTQISNDLAQHLEVLTEAIQTVMRRYQCENPYEQLKALSRGKKIDKETLHTFIKTLAIPDPAKQQLLSLTPENYIGLAENLAKTINK